ncbi:MAG: hypothetical protein HC842_09350 [Cytophagales bacterium]|nr:hypothetical protein [Cytophagales bacterium]
MKIGDKVRFLYGQEEGIIVQFIDDKTAEVEIEEGFPIPVLKKELVVVATEESKFFGKKTEKPPTEVERLLAHGHILGNDHVLFTFTEEDGGSTYRTHVVNDSPHQVLFSIFELGHEGKRGVECGLLLPGQKQFIDTRSFSEFPKWNPLEIHLSFFRKGLHEQRSSVERTISFRAGSFFKKRVRVEQLKGEAIVYRLEGEEIKVDAQKLQERLSQGPVLTAPESFAVSSGKAQEVDLHIEALRPDHVHIPSSEILGIQLQAFEKALDQALLTRANSLTLIHGVGNGVLKTEIHKRLSEMSHLYKHYKDAHKEKFGYGATLVQFH